MRRILIVCAVVSTAAFAPSALGGTANGGGRGTLDCSTPFSQFGFGTFGPGGAAHGSFNCLMAGRARFLASSR